MARNLRIVAWNANGILSKRNELQYFVTDLDADVVLVSESHLQAHHSFRLPAYVVYRTDRPPRAQDRRNPGGGTAVLIHRRLAHREHIINTNNVESTGVIIHAGGTEILVVAAYIKPTARFNQADFNSLFSAQGPVIVAGDLNSKHPSWNSRVTNPKGRALRRYLDLRGGLDVLAPQDPTFYPTNGQEPDVLDIVLHKDMRFDMDVRVIDDLSSDHLPVLLSIGMAPTRIPAPWTTTVRTDWRRFHGIVAGRLAPMQLPGTVAELDERVAYLHDVMSLSVTEATTPVQQRQQRDCLPHKIRAEIVRRRRLRRVWRLTRSPAAKQRFNAQNTRVKNIVNDYRSETWESYLNSLDIDSGSAWRAAKTLRRTKSSNQPLHSQAGLAYSSQDKAEVFADTMEDQFQTHGDVYDERQNEIVEHFMGGFFSTEPEDEIQPFTLEEVRNAVRRANPRKASGLDRIGVKALQNAPPLIVHLLLMLFNSALRLRHFPASWKSAKIILIKKPNKSALYPENYRPISLLPVISKFFEKLLLTRLFPFLEDYIRPEQFGFRQGHSTTLQLVRVVNKLADAHNLNLATVAVCLDVSKAFDRVWHEGLLCKLSDSPIPDSAVHLLRSYLTGRSFRTSVDGELSTIRPIGAGVPQGSVLGPVLYLIYTNDLPTVPGVTLSLYADDAMLHCSSDRPRHAVRVMQGQMNVLSPWLERWRIKVNADKSDAICFRKRRRMPRAVLPPVELNDEPIPWQKSLKYLGVTLDERLNFGAHVKTKVREAENILGLLGPLVSARSVLPVRVKLLFFLMIVRSVLMYASTAWWALASRSNRTKIERVQRKALRRLSNQPWFVRNATINSSLNVPTLGAFAFQNATRMFQRAAESGFPHIEEIATRRRDLPEDWRPRPAAILDDPP